MLPSADVVFDTGRCPQRSVFARNVLITHCHLDHLGGLPHHVASRSVFGSAVQVIGQSQMPLCQQVGLGKGQAEVVTGTRTCMGRQI